MTVLCTVSARTCTVLKRSVELCGVSRRLRQPRSGVISGCDHAATPIRASHLALLVNHDYDVSGSFLLPFHRGLSGSFSLSCGIVPDPFAEVIRPSHSKSKC